MSSRQADTSRFLFTDRTTFMSRDFKALKAFKFSETSEDECCAICLEDFRDLLDNTKAVTRVSLRYSKTSGIELPCGHRYCSPCITDYFETPKDNDPDSVPPTNCPCCRKDFFPKEQPFTYRYQSLILYGLYLRKEIPFPSRTALPSRMTLPSRISPPSRIPLPSRIWPGPGPAPIIHYSGAHRLTTTAMAPSSTASTTLSETTSNAASPDHSGVSISRSPNPDRSRVPASSAASPQYSHVSASSNDGQVSTTPQESHSGVTQGSLRAHDIATASFTNVSAWPMAINWHGPSSILSALGRDRRPGTTTTHRSLPLRRDLGLEEFLPLHSFEELMFYVERDYIQRLSQEELGYFVEHATDDLQTYRRQMLRADGPVPMGPFMGPHDAHTTQRRFRMLQYRIATAQSYMNGTIRRGEGVDVVHDRVEHGVYYDEDGDEWEADEEVEEEEVIEAYEEEEEGDDDGEELEEYEQDDIHDAINEYFPDAINEYFAQTRQPYVWPVSDDGDRNYVSRTRHREIRPRL